MLQQEGEFINMDVLTTNERPCFTDEPASAVNPTTKEEQHKGSNTPKLLKLYYRASEKYITLVTHLEADDGIELKFVEKVQKEASEMKQKVSSNRISNKSSPFLRFFCVDDHWEWQPETSWLKETGEESTETKTFGSLVEWSSSHCITAGLTVAYPPSMQHKDISINFTHNKLHRPSPRPFHGHALNG